MKPITLLTIVAGTLFASAVAAQDADDIRAMTPEDRKSYFQAMSPEERTAKREELRDHFDSLSEEVRRLRRSLEVDK